MTNDHRALARDQLLEKVQHENLLMGVLNTTPDSFSDGGKFSCLENALRRARSMVRGGANIVDVGGESTRPGAARVSATEELIRVSDIIRKLVEDNLAPVSIDTYKARVARQAAHAGAVIINDVSGMTFDDAMADTVAETESIIVVTYNRAAVDEQIDIVDDARRFFERAFEKAHHANIPKRHIWLDPGIGFAKTLDQNFEILRRIDEICEYAHPVLVGVSRKSFIGNTLNRSVHARLPGTLAAGLAALNKGARVLRVHDVRAHKDAMKINQLLRVS